MVIWYSSHRKLTQTRVEMGRPIRLRRTGEAVGEQRRTPGMKGGKAGGAAVTPGL